MSSSLEHVRRRWLALTIWSLVCVGLFVYCWMDQDFDDLSGWIPIMYFVQLPVFVVAVQPGRAAPALLPKGWVVASAIALGLVTSYCVFLLVAVWGSWIWHDDFIDMRPIWFGFLAWLVVFLSTSVRFSLRLRRGAHPRELRRGLYELVAAALLMLGAVAITLYSSISDAFFGKQGVTREGVLLLALPLLWTSPFWLLLPRRERGGAPTAKVL